MGGPTPIQPLPFKCRMFQDVTATEAAVTKPAAPAGKDGKYEVLFPVGIPDQGVFQWADMFLQKHPEYTELSNRSIRNMMHSGGANAAAGTSRDNANLGSAADVKNLRQIF